MEVSLVMEKNARLQVYQGMIQYLVESTNYNFKNIAELTNTSIKHIRSIYHGEASPAHQTEMKLLMLYQFILKLQFQGYHENP